MKRYCVGIALALTFAFTFALTTTAQNFTDGFKAFQSYDSNSIDSVNLATGNLFVHIPVISYPQRGQLPDLGFSLVFNNPTWTLWFDGMYTFYYLPVIPASGLGLYVVRNDLPTGSGLSVPDSDYTVYFVSGASGDSHTMGWTSASTLESIDASGFKWDSSSLAITNSAGIQYSLDGGPSATTSDKHGNTIVPHWGGSPYHLTNWTDSVGRTIPAPTIMTVARTTVGCETVNYPVPGGVTAAYQFCYSNVTLSHPGDSVGMAYSGVTKLMTSLVTPHGTWSFTYDNYGDLATITTPAGGTITYTTSWGPPGSWPYGQREVTQRAVNDGTGAQNWAYGWGSGVGRVVTSPDGDDTTHMFGAGYYETQTKYYHGSYSSGTLLKTEDRTYSQGASSNPFYGVTGDATPLGITPKSVTTTWPNGQVSSVCTIFDGNSPSSACGTDNYSGSATFYDANVGTSPTYPLVYGSVRHKYEYDYGTGSAGSIKLTTDTDYQWLHTTSYLTANLLGLPYSVNVYDGTSTLAGEATYSYDQSGSSSCSSSAPCGDLTTVNRYYDSTHYITTQTHFSSYGMPTLTIDGKGNHTCYTYNATNAYVSEIQHPTPSSGSTCSSVLKDDYTYDTNTGLITSHTDPNSRVTSYGYDSIRRLTSVSYPDGGSDAYVYTDTTPNPYFDFTKAIDTGVNLVERGTVDGFGRVIKTRTTVPSSTCSGGYAYVNTTYDHEGRKGFVSNPDCSSTTTTGTTYAYDALNRVTTTTEADGSTIGSSYSDLASPHSFCTTVTDEAGKTRQSCADGLGRLIEVWEDPGTTPHLNLATTYTYDAHDNLTGVSQSSSRTRSFTYDWLSRMTQSVNPESGTINYTYDSNGNVATKIAPQANQTGSSTTTTTYAYDADDRLTSRTYSDGTPTASFQYDTSSLWGLTLQNPLGRLVWSGTASGQHVSSYDSMGRVLVQVQCTPYNCTSSFWTLTNTYNYRGGQKTYTNGMGVTFSQSFDVVGRLTQVTSSLVDSTHPATLASSIGYNPAGLATQMTYGNGLTESRYYDSRLQPCRINVNSSSIAMTACTGSAPSGNVQDFQYGFNAGTSDSGNVISWNGTGNQTFTRSYAYDNLNRLWTLGDSVTTNPCRGLSWSYDNWGNRTAQTVTAGSCTASSLGFNSSNQINNTGYVYDAAGNLKTDGTHTYYYDGENRLIQVDGTLGTCSTATGCYAYDADGRRVQKVTPTKTNQYIYDLSDHVIAEWQSSWSMGYVYANGQLLAQYSSGTSFAHKDHLGSTRLLTSYNTTSSLNQLIVDSMDYAPFGEEISGDTGSTHKFTGKERDSESNLDNFGARYISSQYGRFMSPDWSLNPQAIPFAAIGNPQSLNLYSYVGNNPVTLTDANGHCWNWIQVVCNIAQGVANLALYAEPVSNANLNAALQRQANSDLARMTNEGVLINGKSAADYLRGKSNKDIVDAYEDYVDAIHKGTVGHVNPGAVAALVYPTTSLQHAFKHASDFGVNGNWNSDTAADFQKALEDIVNGPDTKAYDIEFRGQSGYKAYVDQPTGKAVIFDSNGRLAAAWDLGPNQMQGVVVNGKLW